MTNTELIKPAQLPSAQLTSAVASDGMHPHPLPVNGAAFPFAAPVHQFYQPQFSVNPPASQPTKGSGGTRSGVCASRHMAAEQRRRARINERLEALRTLVPHSARANTAAFLTEVYSYISALHKQLERLGYAPLDLNVSSTDLAKKDGGTKSKSVSQVSNDPKVSPEAVVVSRSDESEVDSEESKESRHECKEDENIDSPVLAPSLFDPTNKKFSSQSAPSVDTVQSDAPEMPNCTPLPSSPPLNDLSLSMKLPNSQVCSNFSQSSDTCSAQMALPFAPLVPSPMKPRLREIQPAPLPMNPAQPPFSLLPIPSSVVAAATAAFAESAAAAQSWGMAAVVAQAQAQVAAQVHAQAQAQVQAMAQAQSQFQTFTPNFVPPGSASSATSSQTRKRRRSNGSESCSSRQKKSQTVVRPIALKASAMETKMLNL